MASLVGLIVGRKPGFSARTCRLHRRPWVIVSSLPAVPMLLAERRAGLENVAARRVQVCGQLPHPLLEQDPQAPSSTAYARLRPCAVWARIVPC
jgi:hypothetical protein